MHESFAIEKVPRKRNVSRHDEGAPYSGPKRYWEGGTNLDGA